MSVKCYSNLSFPKNFSCQKPAPNKSKQTKLKQAPSGCFYLANYSDCSTDLTACICFRSSWQNFGIMLALIILSSFVAALIGVSGPLAIICNIVPSHPAFDGIMALSAGYMGTAVKDVGILAIHCVAWFALYVLISSQHKKQATQ